MNAALSPHEWIVIAVTMTAILLILSNRLRADLVAILVLLALAISGVVDPREALSGFSNNAVIVIIGLFVITEGLENTGVVTWIAGRLRRLGGGSEPRLVFLIMATGAGFALVMNIVAAGAVLLPAALQVARESRVRVSKVLIPLSFGTLVGAMMTYFATANIVISGMLAERGLRPLGIVDFLPTGLLIAPIAIAFMTFIGRRLLPARDSAAQQVTPADLSRSLFHTYQLDERLWEVMILPESRLVTRQLGESRIDEALGLSVLGIWRGGEAILTPSAEELIHTGDYLLVLGREERVRELTAWGVQVGRDARAHIPEVEHAVDLSEIIIPPRSQAVGKTLSDLRFRAKTGMTALALWREGRSYRTDVGKFTLQVGDALLVVGGAAGARALAGDRDFLMIGNGTPPPPPYPRKAPFALAILVGVLALSITNLIPTAEAMLAGAVAMVLTGCLNMDEAYRAIEWRVVFLIAGMMPISTAIVSTGLADRVGAGILAAFLPFGALAVIAGMFLLTMLVTQILAGQVSALIVGPIAITAALQAGIDPHAMAVAAATACATAFLLPTAHPVNVLMMGPGGYKPSDFLRIGLPMTVIVFVLLLLGMVIFWRVPIAPPPVPCALTAWLAGAGACLERALGG